MTDDTRQSDSGADPIERLIRAAGGREPLPALRARRIRAACEPTWRREVARARRRRVGGALALAASALLAAGLWLWRSPDELGTRPPAPVATLERSVGPVELETASGRARRTVAPGEGIPAGATLIAGPASRAALTLPGCASLRLDHGTVLAVTAADRVELAHGAVYVDSTAGAGCELSIATPFGAVDKVGTQFEVRLVGASVRVRVREGRVTIRGPGPVVEVGAREEVVVLEDQSPIRQAIKAHGRDWGWVAEIAPPPEGEALTLGDFLAWAEREMGWRASFADPVLAADRSRLEVDLPDRPASPEELLPLVLAACELDYRLNDGVLLIGERAGDEDAATASKETR